ncbi:hypothetical protein INR49_013687 [Caranx melampygus]|nr:hypothetical protein INR49_013687 [Caranx melampygus]
MMNDKVVCKECVLAGEFKVKDLCAAKPCDNTTANCESKDGSFTCSCNENYIKTNFSDRICIACPSGKRARDSLECEDCPFGRSGFNCKETWKLMLVIVGSVLGALLLITLILLPVVALKPSKKKSKKSKNADSGDYVSSAPVKVPLVSSNSSFANSQAPAVNGSSFGNAGVPRIPRATSTNGWDSRTNLEMTRQTPTPVSRNQHYDDQDNINPYAQSRQSSLYGQGRPQNNSYAQNRAQVNPYAQNQGHTNPYAQNQGHTNPYAQNQGHTNPYYVHDDGRRY